MTDARDDRREANADAKAAKARAKAMRPWWKKKRFILPLAFVILIAIIAVTTGNSGDDTEQASTGSDSESDGATSGQADEADDITVTSCEKDDIGMRTVKVGWEATNNSSKRSNYLVSFTIEDDAGVKVGEAHDVINDVEPGQTARSDAVGSVSGEPASVKCRTTNVDRLASS